MAGETLKYKITVKWNQTTFYCWCFHCYCSSIVAAYSSQVTHWKIWRWLLHMCEKKFAHSLYMLCAPQVSSQMRKKIYTKEKIYRWNVRACMRTKGWDRWIPVQWLWYFWITLCSTRWPFFLLFLSSVQSYYNKSLEWMKKKNNMQNQ